jgi:hypothetical protein
VVIGAFIVTGQAQAGDVLAALGFVGRGNLILREDGFVRAFRDAGAAVNAGVWIDIVPGPLFDRLAGDDTFHRADIHATGVAQTQTGNNMGHCMFLLIQDNYEIYLLDDVLLRNLRSFYHQDFNLAYSLCQADIR